MEPVLLAPIPGLPRLQDREVSSQQVYPKVEEDSGTEELQEDMQEQRQPTAPKDKDAEEP